MRFRLLLCVFYLFLRKAGLALRLQFDFSVALPWSLTSPAFLLQFGFALGCLFGLYYLLLSLGVSCYAASL